MVSISNAQSIPFNETFARRVVKAVLEAEGEAESEVSLHFTNDTEIRELNYQYRHIDQPTDVLAFAMREGPIGELHTSLLGDIIISVETARRQAAEGRFKQELALLMIHGVLHLLGYDHELPESAIVMEAKQKQLLELFAPLPSSCHRC